MRHKSISIVTGAGPLEVAQPRVRDKALNGPNASGFSANVVVRPKEQWSQEYDTWNRRDLSGKHYVYLWADGIYANVRLEDEANSRQCLLDLVGATAEGEKERIAVIDGYRESKQSWMEVLVDLKKRPAADPGY